MKGLKRGLPTEMHVLSLALTLFDDGCTDHVEPNVTALHLQANLTQQALPDLEVEECRKRCQLEDFKRETLNEGALRENDKKVNFYTCLVS